MRSPSVTSLCRLLRSLLAQALRRPRIAIVVAVLAVAGLGLGATALLSARQPAVPPTTQSTVFSGSWSLGGPTRHADAGDVAAVTVPKAGDAAAPASLVAKTTDGKLMKIDLTVDPGSAAAALASLGHGDLLTADAWAVVRAGRAGEAAPSD